MSAVTLAHAAAGPAHGPPVVLLHSIGTDRSLWDDHVGPLAAAGHRVLTVDLRGHGASPVPPGPYAVADLGDDVVATLDALGLASADLVGVSIGGAIALSLAARRPQRVRRLVVCCSAPWFGGPDVWGPRAAAARDEGLGALVAGTVERWFTAPFRAGHPARVARIARVLAGTAPEGYAACADALAAVDLRPALPAVAAPTLVIGGADDVATPVERGAAVIAAAVPGARLEVVPAAHLAPYERPDLVGALLRRHLRAERTR